MTNGQSPEKLLRFVNAIASGMDQTEAYLQHIAKPNCAKRSATFTASKILGRPAVKDMLIKAKEEHALALKLEMEKQQKIYAKEFLEGVLTVDHLDSFHSSVIQGLVDVEEFIPVYTVEEILDATGTRVVKRIRKPGLLPTKRKPNIREKQTSVDALYKRFGNYAPSKLFGAFGQVPDDGGDLQNVKRFIILANGERVPLP